MTEGMAGLLREKSRPPGIAPLPAATVDQVLSLTGAPPPGEATHWTVRAMAKAVGLARLGAADLAGPRSATPPLEGL